MSDIKINGGTYREEDVAFNWGAYFKNNGDGNMYVYSLMREVDVE